MKRGKRGIIYWFSISSLILLAGFILGGCNQEGKSKEDEKAVNIFNWSQYIPDHVIEKFEEETGIKVNYDTYASNEEMYAKLSAGQSGYDVVVPTLYYLEIMEKQGMLEKINKDNLPHLKNIDQDFMGLYVDPKNDYSVPFMWGTGIIAVNEKLIDKEVTGYKDLFDPQFKNSIVASDDMRFVLGAMLAMEGNDPNTQDEKQIEEAGKRMKELLPNIKLFDNESPKTVLANNEVKAGILYGGEAILAQRENPDIKLVLPKEYLLLWQENLVIPKGAPHKENVEKFIDFLLQPEISKEITMSYPYGNPNKEALKLLPEDLRSLIELPTDELKRGIYAKDVGEATAIYDRVWAEVKQ
ncbi:PotD/PotF family extracellular solute-binding protein [Pseudobacillus sp. 179-B 2D1 NHS]|uniref:PotD/PotF family extracellular solute-binding protein n=1 Tax=Pseudobacillus sp. 179-B 2D1 NHS TaxID=3374292 RepID=UPI0038790869